MTEQTEKHPMPKIDMDTQKDAVKEALKEWLDEAFATFGKWTFSGVMAAAFAGAVYLMLKGQGWSK